ncbi:Trp biosynthesis-associated membrane protein [Nocardioides sp. SYSU DS0663]|uniref:Trp biosynthesis-associated membrane protein n=1 Tax=Nocardioides sp. SYSU DS0663 TaxID=3416445 RepID=UPI003F4B8A63
MPDQSRGRRAFGPVVLAGLAGGTLAAVGGTRPWAVAQGGDHAVAASYALTDAGEMPSATAAALVVLACWGVVLVSRGRVRRAVAVLGAVAAAGVVAAVVIGWSTTAEAVRGSDLALAGAAGVGHTGWFWASAAGAVLALVAGVSAVLLVPQWPEMGSRYDGPAAGRAPVEPGEASNLELWRAMDDGHDPTA